MKIRLNYEKPTYVFYVPTGTHLSVDFTVHCNQNDKPPHTPGAIFGPDCFLHNVP